MFKEYYGHDKVGMGVGFQFFWKVKHTKQKYSDIHSYWNQYKCHTLIISILSYRFWSILTVLFREWLYPLLLCLVWLAMFSPSSFCAPLGLTWRFDFFNLYSCICICKYKYTLLGLVDNDLVILVLRSPSIDMKVLFISLFKNP